MCSTARLFPSKQRTLLVSAGLVAMITSLAAYPAAAQTITFDAGDPIGGLAAGTTLSNQYASLGVTFVANALVGAGGPTGDWATNTDMTVVSSTGSDVGGLGTPALASGNILRSFDGWLSENGDSSFRAVFSTPISTLSATFVGINTVSSTQLQAFNGTTLLATSTATVTGQQILTVSSPTPITSVVFRPGDFFDWVGVDNIAFTKIVAATAPEPGSLGLLGIVGLPVAYGVRRRREQA